MTAPEPTGSFVMVSPEHVDKVGLTAAYVFARIVWRSQANGEWPARFKDIADETHLKEPTVRDATKRLRDAGWVTATRRDATDPTLVWTPVFAGQAVNTDSIISGDGIHHHVNTESIISSSVEKITTPLPPQGGPSGVDSVSDASAGSPEPPALFAVPDVETTPKRRRARPKTECPPDFRPTQNNLKTAHERGVNLHIEGPKFLSYHQAKGSLFADWHAALNTWILNQHTYAIRDAAKAAAAPAIDRRSSLNAQVDW